MTLHVQTEQLGLGHAVLSASESLHRGEPFVLPMVVCYLVGSNARPPQAKSAALQPPADPTRCAQVRSLGDPDALEQELGLYLDREEGGGNGDPLRLPAAGSRRSHV